MDRLYRGGENLPEMNISDDEIRGRERDHRKENKDARFRPRHPTLFVQRGMGRRLEVDGRAVFETAAMHWPTMKAWKDNGQG